MASEMEHCPLQKMWFSFALEMKSSFIMRWSCAKCVSVTVLMGYSEGKNLLCCPWALDSWGSFSASCDGLQGLAGPQTPASASLSEKFAQIIL